MAAVFQELLTVDEDVLGIGFQRVDLEDLAATQLVTFFNNDRCRSNFGSTSVFHFCWAKNIVFVSCLFHFCFHQFDIVSIFEQMLIFVDIWANIVLSWTDVDSSILACWTIWDLKKPGWTTFELIPCWLYGSPVWFCGILIFVASILFWGGLNPIFCWFWVTFLVLTFMSPDTVWTSLLATSTYIRAPSWPPRHPSGVLQSVLATEMSQVWDWNGIFAGSSGDS